VNRAYAALVRSSAFLRKEAAEVIRQPRLLLTLIVGPFIILLVFGAGLRDADPPFDTVFVAPQDQELAEEVREFAEGQEERLTVHGITRDEGSAMRQLRTGALDMVVVFPDGVEETVRADEHAIITLYHNQMDPIENRALLLYLEHAVSEVNRQIVARAIEEGQADTEELHERVTQARRRVASARRAADDDDDGRAELELANLRAETAALALAVGPAAAILESTSGDDTADGQAGEDDTLQAAVARFSQRVDTMEDSDDVDREGEELERDLLVMEDALDEFRDLSPEVLASPFRGEVRRLTGNNVELGDFYAPAVVILLLQHLLVTFVSLSVVRERELGTTELYQVAPLRVGELVVGKYLAYMIIATLVSATLIAALVLGLGVPMEGSWWAVALVLFAVMVASCGLGLCVAAVSRTDSQAVQYTMLVLLATVFFSGFTLSLDRFMPPFQWIGFLLPASYGVHLLRSTMLGGVLDQPELLATLGVFALLLGALGWFGTSRTLRQT
jgi:ABC-2 type transport system permease protein